MGVVPAVGQPWYRSRSALAPLVLGITALAIGIVVAREAAVELVDHQAYGTTFGLLLVAAALFVVASMLTLRVETEHRAWGVVHWLVLWILATVAVSTLGYFVVRFTEHQSVAVRVLSQFGVAVVAGATLLIPGLSGAIAGLLGLRAAGRALSRRGGPDEAYAQQLELRADQWKPPPWGRWWRLLVRCITMTITGMAFSLIAQGIAYGAPASIRASDLFIPAAGWLVGSALGWYLVGEVIHFSPEGHRGRHFTHGIGAAWLFVLVLLGVVGAQAAHSAGANLFRHDGSLTYAPGASVPGGLGDQALAEAFKPDLRFSAGERWRPTSVAWYLENTKVVRLPKCTAGPCIARSLTCDNRTDGCTDGAPANPLIYALVKSVAGTMPAPFADVTRMVQYWFFYNYDSFDRPFVSQWHQGDWEQVTVGVADTQPRFVAYSEHCFGALLRWPDVAVTNSTHPVVWVAEGTHANYPRPIRAPLRGAACFHVAPPRYTGASGLPFGLIESGGSLEVSGDYATGETDRIGAETGAFPVQTIDAAGPIASFPGDWGVDNLLAIDRGKGVRLGAGPGSPANHAEWQHPVAAMLCNQRWFTKVRVRCGKT